MPAYNEHILVRIESDGKPVALDFIKNGVGRWSGEEPDLSAGELMSWEEFESLHDSYYTTDWTHTDEDTFYEMLEVLPPLFYASRDGWSVFQMSELHTGDITGTYAWHEATDTYLTCHRPIIRSKQVLREVTNTLNNHDFINNLTN